VNKHEIPTGIKSDSTNVKFIDLHKAFANTEYGKTMSENARYERYKPKNITLSEWERLLGVDVNNLKHLQLSLNLAKQFIKYSNEMRAANTGQSTESLAFLNTNTYNISDLDYSLTTHR